MVDRPTLNVAVEGTKNKPSAYNQNFELMMKYCEDCMAEDKGYVDDALETVSALQDEVADVKSYASYITATVEDSGLTDTNYFTSEMGAQVPVVNYGNDVFGISVGNTQNNGNWSPYDAGKYWTKKTYNNYDDLVEVECGGEIKLQVLLTTRTQSLYIPLPVDIDDTKFNANISFSNPMTDGMSDTDSYTDGEPMSRGYTPAYCYNSKTSLTGRRFAYIMAELPKVTTNTTFNCILVWSAKLNKLEVEQEGE